MAVCKSSLSFWLTWVCSTMVMVSWASSNADKDALLALKQRLSDPDNVLSSWDPNLVDPCTWLRIVCDSDNHVIRVDIGQLNLSGKLVPELGNMQYLQYLEMYKNNIEGSMPPELGNLKSLISLDLYNNNLSGSIPPELGNLKSLLFLRLNDNHLTGKVPLEVLSLPLKVLDLSHNNLTGPFPATVSKRLNF